MSLLSFYSFTFISSKIFILRPITSLVCVVSFTLGSHYIGSSSSPFVCAFPLSRLSSRHVLARSAASISRRCWDRPLRSSLAPSSQSVLVAPALSRPSLFRAFRPATPRDRGEAAISAHASILMQFPRNHRDVHAMPAVGSHETWRLQAKIRHRPTERHRGRELIFQIAPFSSSTKFKPHARTRFHLLSTFYTCLFVVE